jgi:hypothetical protein
MTHPFRVPFLTVEDGEDLIVSFPLDEHARTSLTLLRTPKYESLLEEDERGVSVGFGFDHEETRELLVSLRWSKTGVELRSTSRYFAMDLTAVSPEEIEEAKAVLQKMNEDRCFECKDV